MSNISGFLPDSPITKENNFKRVSKKKKHFDEISNPPIFKKKPISIPEPKPKIQNEDKEKLEIQYKAIIAYEIERVLHKTVSNARAEEIVKKYQVGSVRNLQRIAKKVRDDQSLIRNKGSGRPATVSNREDIICFIEEKAKEWDYTFNLRAMAGAVVQEFGVGSTTSITRILENEDWRKFKAYIKPYLTDKHKEARLSWCLERIKNNFFSADKVPVH